MSNKIILKKSSVVNKIPIPADLEYGEVAINYTDGKLYYKDNTNQIQHFLASFTGGASGPNFSTISVSGQDLVVAEVNSDTLNLIAGQGIVLTTDSATDSITISSNVSFQSFGVDARTQTVSTILSPLMQTYMNYDSITFRNPLGKIATRFSEISVIG